MNVTFTHSLFFLIAAIVCFVVALLISLAVISGTPVAAWVIGGLLAFALAHLP